MTCPLLALDLPSGPDIILITLLALVLFGANQLPLFGQRLGRGWEQFRQAMDDFMFDLDRCRHFQQYDKPARSRVFQMLPLILFVAAIVLLLVSLAAHGPH